MQTKNWIEKSNKSLNGILLMTAGILVVSVEDAGSKFLVEADYHPFHKKFQTARFYTDNILPRAAADAAATMRGAYSTLALDDAQF